MKQTLTEQIGILKVQLNAAEQLRALSEASCKSMEAKLRARAEANGALKIELANALAEVARLKGYVARVHEQDDTNSDRVPLELEPRRTPSLVPASRLARGEFQPDDGRVMGYVGRDRDTSAPPHWTAL